MGDPMANHMTQNPNYYHGNQPGMSSIHPNQMHPQMFTNMYNGPYIPQQFDSNGHA